MLLNDKYKYNLQKLNFPTAKNDNLADDGFKIGYIRPALIPGMIFV